MSVDSTDLVELDRTDDLLEVRLNRPDKLNALNPELIEGLHEAFTAVADERGLGIVITGAGRVTCAGMDTEIVSGDYGEYPDLHATLQEVYQLIETHPGPVAIAGRGALVGAGAIISLSCEFVVLSEDATFAIPEVKYDIASARAADRLPDVVGPRAAAELLLTGEEIDPERARSLGLATDVVPSDAVEDRARELVATVGDHDPETIAELIELLNGGADT
ncbi:enoyl-CoA hydratase/isomerase family protein [Natronolimnohabitans innermongolicus]|uniref:Enoyl-CoA hydratase/carnithine racemase n=1 Tax=Natronolimnohabitans innermongolicus JCM 12255 TaxID=1227499 RepID=L9WLV8_9EURY|nr:enoyl-CoA hydratase/isomerase family protein [Natronolimnohabitans innermongolicus]ELY50455.1 enoyl-CoA hydratase/carnithine racemase [Natronolimnohabitans innermongolicus JCM 12255]